MGFPDSRITAADVRASYNRNVKSHFAVTWFARPIADLWTPVFFNRGWSANEVTLLRTVVSFLALILLGTGRWEAHIGAVAGFYVGFILDCVDGNLCRLNDSASYWGKFIDGLSDSIYVLLAPLATGIGLWFSASSGGALLAGAVITSLALITQMVRNRLSFFREWMISQSGPLLPAEAKAREKGLKLEQAIAPVVVNGTFVAPLLLLLPGGAAYYLWTLAVVQGASDVFWLAALLGPAHKLLRRKRKSIHAAPVPLREKPRENKTVG